MQLTPREIGKLFGTHVAELARRRRQRGAMINLIEAQALISEAGWLPGVRERLSLLQDEATFVDGSKLVDCHDPVAA